MESETLAPTLSDLTPTASEGMDVDSPEQMHIESQTQAAQVDKMDTNSDSQVEGAADVHGSGMEDAEDDEELIKHNLISDDEKDDDGAKSHQGDQDFDGEFSLRQVDTQRVVIDTKTLLRKKGYKIAKTSTEQLAAGRRQTGNESNSSSGFGVTRSIAGASSLVNKPLYILKCPNWRTSIIIQP